MTAINIQPVAEICSASHDDAQFGERDIKLLRDISGFEYGTQLYAGAAPAAVAPWPQGEYPPINPKDFGSDSDLWCYIDAWHHAAPGEASGEKCQWLESHIQRLMRAYFDLGRQPAAAPALEAPAAPGVPPGFALVPLRLTRAMDEAISEEGWQWEDLLAAAQAVTEEQYEASAQDRLSQDEVRAIFLDCGFVIKEGQTDLKPYVYEAAQVLESRVRAIAAAAPQAPAAPSEDTHVFTTPYPELNDLLRETSFLASEGANMDGAVLWLESLERVLALLAAPAAPAVDAETIEDAERFRAMAKAALTDDEVFGRALDQHPDMGGDATIDDVRAMFDAARAAQAKEGGA